jgi:hypothetical protein
MQFLMLVCVDNHADREVATNSPGMEIEEWVDKMDGAGIRLMGDRIQPESVATTVRVRNDQVLVTDGPFLETKEALAGFDVLECRDLDHAIEVATAHPMARGGVIELRPFWDWDSEG